MILPPLFSFRISCEKENHTMYDIAIIGAGVTGCAIAREISRYKADVLVLEREEDVCCGTTKANSAILHAGFDAAPGSLKAELNVRGNAMMDTLCEELDIPLKRNGALVVCTKEEDRPALAQLLDRGVTNGVSGLRIIERNELIRMEPSVSDDAVCALYAPGSGIVCPFEMTIAFAENACANGVSFFRDTEVLSLHRTTEAGGGYEIRTVRTGTETEHIFTAKIIVNAAGVYADRFNNQVSSRRLHITARRGEYFLLDKTAGSHVSRTIFQLPSAMGKGVLVTPTVHGNLLIGPTAGDVEDKEAVNTTQGGLSALTASCARSVKDIPLRQVITSFAGLRAHEEGGDFVIGEASDAPGFINAAGIESPGLTSAPAIAKRVAAIAKDLLSLREKADFIPVRRGILRPQTLTMEERSALIRRHPEYGAIVCRCEMISEGEILDAIRRPLGARSLDAVKRRTRAGMGRCQSGFCSPRTMELLAREVPMAVTEITKSGAGSAILTGVPPKPQKDGKE